MPKATALIIGVGDGVSASFARLLHREGYRLCLAARNTDKLSNLAAATSADVFSCDATKPDAVVELFSKMARPLRVVLYNPSARTRGSITELDPDEVRSSIEATAFGAFLAGQEAARLMLEQDPDEGKRGTILFTGASAGLKGFPQSAPFAMGKFAQRGLAQSMSRELHPKGIHVAWINIDGGIRNPSRPERIDPPENPDSMLDPDAIAESYLHLVKQHRSTWTEELALRPWVERF